MAPTKQVNTRIPSDLVDFADGLVIAGEAASRAEVIVTALRHEQRRRAEEREIEILRATAGRPYPDLDDFHDAALRVGPWNDLD